jgi:taurine dioxygenase
MQILSIGVQKRRAAVATNDKPSQGDHRRSRSREDGMSQIDHGFRVSHLQPFGVRIEGVDLRRPLSAEQQARFRDLLFEHGVLVFERQALEDADQRRLMGYLGRVAGGLNGFTMLDPEGNLGRTNICFHSDYAFTSTPITALSLFAADVNDGQTCTRFACGARGYDLLPADLRAALEGAEALSVLPIDQGLVQVDQPVPANMPSIVREAIIDHPVNGRRTVYVHEMQCAGVVGMADAESRTLLHAVYDHLYQPANVYTHRWNRGDLVVWDNVGVHHARPPLEGVTRRSLRRIATAEKDLVELCPEYAGANGPLAMLSRGQVVEPAA